MVAKRSLILAGGGLKVAYQAGVLQVWLDEAGLTFDHADACSGGTFNLAMYCQGMSGTQIADNWRAFPVLRSISVNWLQALRLYWSASLLTYKKFRSQVLGGKWKLDWEAIRANEKRPGTFNTYNFSKNVLEVIESAQMDEDKLIACVSLPMWFPPVQIGQDYYIDGVYLTDANVLEAVKRGADELWIIWTVSRKAQWQHGFVANYFQIIETVANGNLKRDLDRIEVNNRAIAEGKVGEFGRTIKVEILAAEVPLHYLMNVTSPGFTAAVEQGIADARAWCRERKLALLTDARPGIDLIGLRFKETMRGPFSFGATDPEEGYKKGLTTGSSLALHCDVHIPALDRFLNEPDHTGELAATLSFDNATFGQVNSTSGVFNLFKPAPTQAAPASTTSALKNFVYDVQFEHNGRHYYLVGRKDVRKGGRLWDETTTLHVRLHEGKDARGPVVGAGIISLGVPELLSLLKTMEVENAHGDAERLAALLRFGRLFLGELWDSYARHLPGLP